MQEFNIQLKWYITCPVNDCNSSPLWLYLLVSGVSYFRHSWSTVARLLSGLLSVRLQSYIVARVKIILF